MLTLPALVMRSGLRVPKQALDPALRCIRSGRCLNSPLPLIEIPWGFSAELLLLREVSLGMVKFQLALHSKALVDIEQLACRLLPAELGRLRLSSEYCFAAQLVIG